MLCIAAFAQPVPETLKIPRVTRAPRLADFANGVARETELAVSDYRQMDPRDGAPVSQPTTAFLSYDDKNLYVGRICKDGPAQIRARIAKRKDIESDDRVTLNRQCLRFALEKRSSVLASVFIRPGLPFRWANAG
jgi:hypothetical protein